MPFQGFNFIRNQNFTRDRNAGAPDHFISAEKVDDEMDNVAEALTIVRTAIATVVEENTETFATKADKAEVDEALAEKADKAAVDEAIGDINDALDEKADDSAVVKKAAPAVENTIVVVIPDGAGGKAIRLIGVAQTGAPIEGLGALIALIHGPSRQLFLGNEESGLGIRVIGSVMDAYNFNTGQRQNLTLGSDTHGVHVGAAGLYTPGGIVAHGGFAGDGSLLTGVPSIGVGQTWQDVSASRVADTGYQNTSGKPIQVSVLVNTFNNSIRNLFASPDNASWVSVSRLGNVNSGSVRGALAAIIPHGWFYYVSSSANGSIEGWRELR